MTEETQVIKFCNGCAWVEPDEDSQSPAKEPHVCLYHDERVGHTIDGENLHPMIIQIPDCGGYETFEHMEERLIKAIEKGLAK